MTGGGSWGFSGPVKGAGTGGVAVPSSVANSKVAAMIFSGQRTKSGKLASVPSFPSGVSSRGAMNTDTLACVPSSENP
uniref:Uncharacterized protein n=1 Tax=Streptomyces griseochromogenes TaxID=68214 RepID=M1H3M6_9ACTN|nr:hypothetical protein EX-BLS-3 [Streptomyces griseochromogenes]